MSLKRALVTALILVVAALTAVSLSDDNEQQPAAPVIQDAVWRQLVQRAENCKPHDLLKVNREKSSPEQIEAVHIRSTDQAQFISVFPSYDSQRPTSALYYGPEGYKAGTYSTKIGTNSEGMNYARNEAERQERESKIQAEFGELLNQLGCTS